MTMLTPGVLFLARALQSLVLPCTGILIILKFMTNDHFGVYIPMPWLILVALIGAPLFLAGKITLEDFKQKRRAASLGARMVPRIKGRWPGNLDVLLELLKRGKIQYPADDLWPLLAKMGSTLNLRILWDDTIVTMEPGNIKTILATDFPNYVKGKKFATAMNSVLGTGVFNSDGEMWKFHRQMTRPFFSRDRVSHFDNFERHSADVIHQMRARFSQGYAVDFQDAISRFTLDSASEFLFGHDVRSLSTGLAYPHYAPASTSSALSSPSEDFAVAFGEAQYIISQRGRIGWAWPLAEMWRDKTDGPMKIVNGYLDPILKAAVKKHEESLVMSGALEKMPGEEGDNETLLDQLVKFTTDRTVLKDEILNILIAGRDTTAATLTFAIYLMASHPEALGRLRQEVLEKVGPNARPTYDDIRDMKYLRAVINETMRLFPAVPFDVRETVNETTWPSPDPLERPLYIPAGTTVPYSAFIVHRRTDLWGPDALEFDPDRFLDERVKKYLTHKPFIFVPFNAGPRICLGQQFAYNEMSYMLIRLLQNFSSMEIDMDAQHPDHRPPADWANGVGRAPTEKVWPKMHLTMYAHGGLWVKMGAADQL